MDYDDDDDLGFICFVAVVVMAMLLVAGLNIRSALEQWNAAVDAEEANETSEENEMINNRNGGQLYF